MVLSVDDVSLDQYHTCCIWVSAFITLIFTPDKILLASLLMQRQIGPPLTILLSFFEDEPFYLHLRGVPNANHDSSIPSWQPFLILLDYLKTFEYCYLLNYGAVSFSASCSSSASASVSVIFSGGAPSSFRRSSVLADYHVFYYWPSGVGLAF